MLTSSNILGQDVNHKHIQKNYIGYTLVTLPENNTNAISIGLVDVKCHVVNGAAMISLSKSVMSKHSFKVCLPTKSSLGSQRKTLAATALWRRQIDSRLPARSTGQTDRRANRHLPYAYITVRSGQQTETTTYITETEHDASPRSSFLRLDRSRYMQCWTHATRVEIKIIRAATLILR